MVDAINRARAERDAARAHLVQAPDRPPVLDTAEVYAMIDSRGDVGSAIERAQPERLARPAVPAGVGTAGSLRLHLGAALGVPPSTYRRTFRARGAYESA